MTLRLLAFLAVLFLAAPAGYADNPAAPDRATLVAFWEKSVQQDPHVLVFKKTDVRDVYDFETDFFPYKGRLHLLNAAVSRYSGGYSENLYNGIIEVELPDASPDFLKKYAMSYSAWLQQNVFYYDTAQSVWFPASDWGAHYAVTEQTSSTCSVGAWKKYSSTVVLLGFFLFILSLLVWAIKKQQKKVWAANDKIMERQEHALRMTAESLSNQKAQIALLQKILESVQKP